MRVRPISEDGFRERLPECSSASNTRSMSEGSFEVDRQNDVDVTCGCVSPGQHQLTQLLYTQLND